MTWVGVLISLAVILQSLEALWVKAWPWDVVEPEMPLALRFALRRPEVLNWIRLASALFALVYAGPLAVAALWVTTWLIAIRWRGTFNGGSDFMTFHVLGAWLVSLCFPESERICLHYVAIQLTLSYFVAGVAKIRRREWRSGEALAGFLRKYRAPVAAPFLISWLVIAFELLAPLAWLQPLPFAAVALSFHAANAYAFGLNRFFWAWLAAYPALFAVAGIAGSP